MLGRGTFYLHYKDIHDLLDTLENEYVEAIGNIIVALYLGAKVFLSHVNPVYEWAQSHGLTVYELEKLSQKSWIHP